MQRCNSELARQRSVESNEIVAPSLVDRAVSQAGVLPTATNSRMYLYLLIDRVIHMTSDRLHEQCAAAHFSLSSLCVIMCFDDELELIMYFKRLNKNFWGKAPPLGESP